MKLKIGRYEFDNVTNDDYIIYDGFDYKCITLTHMELAGAWRGREIPTKMSENLFKKLKQQGIITEWKNCPILTQYVNGCIAYKFNVKEN